jgi:NAD(P)-dependent dehydrogenase (short-subunit alcohol dehydrogenase family)
VFGPLEEIPIEWVQVQYETNLLGVIRVIREAIPLMREEGGGTIVVAGSLASRIHLPFQSHYTASKAALVGLCASLRMELRPFGIRVHLVEPTDINTTLGENRKIFIKEGSPYEERARRCLRVTEEAEMKAEPPDVVARLVVDIIEGRRNAGRKVVGRRARLYSMLRAVLPTGMAEGMISLHFET